jgi:riboflavin kinase
MEQLGEIGDSLQTGIYYGWCLLREIPYCAVVSVGWNPFYKNEKKTIEAHLIASLDDFYGEHVSLLLFGYLRDEADFKSLGEIK